MAAIVGNSKATCHVRSISLPSRSHPLTSTVEEQLYWLRTSQATSSSSTSSVCHKLDGLKELYDRVDDLLQLPLTQQTLCNEQCNERLEELLNGSVRLLDMCGTTRDVFSQMKECLQELESSLRRRRGGEFTNEVGAYIISRKKLSKVVGKSFENLKRMEKKCAYSDQVAVVNMLRQVEEISLAVFESLLSFISRPKARSKPNGWPSISKLLLSKRVSCEREVDINETEDLDAQLVFLNSKKSSKEINMQSLLKQLEALQLSIQELEEILECLYRRLVRARVSLLNILNH